MPVRMWAPFPGYTGTLLLIAATPAGLQNKEGKHFVVRDRSAANVERIASFWACSLTESRDYMQVHVILFSSSIHHANPWQGKSRESIPGHWDCPLKMLVCRTSTRNKDSMIRRNTSRSGSRFHGKAAIHVNGVTS